MPRSISLILKEHVISQSTNMAYFQKLCENPDVDCFAVSKSKWLIQYDNEEWLLWPRSGRWARFFAGRQVSDLYYGDVPQFIERYIERTADFPVNHGKTWTTEEHDCIYEMYEMNMSIASIAVELARHPLSTATKVSQLFDVDIESIGPRFFPFLEVGLKDLLAEHTDPLS